TAPANLDRAWIASLVRAFVAEHPGIRIEVSLSNRLVDLVGEGFDLALRAGVLPDSSLVARKVGEGSVSLYAAPDYLRRRGTPRRLDDLAPHACVLYNPKP